MVVEILNFTDTYDRYVYFKEAADRAQRQLAEVTAELLAEMESRHTKSHKVVDGPLKRQFTYVQRTTYKVDEDKLKRALTAKVFNRFTTAKLDMKKLEAAMIKGQIDPTIVAQHTEVKVGAPYIKYTEGVADAEGSEHQESEGSES
jgi:vancomycin resistance protein YoaR